VPQSRVRAALPHHYDRHDYRSIADAYFSPVGAGVSACWWTEVTAAQAEPIGHPVVMNAFFQVEAFEASDNNSDFCV
jgi:hypothetical protein